MNKPYISLNGAGIRDIRNTVDALPKGLSRDDILFGVPVSEKTQLLDIENRYGNEWYPVGDNIKRWFYSLKRATSYKGVIHINFDNPEPLALLAFSNYVLARLSKIETEDSDTGWGTNYGIGCYVDGLQINNFPWHKIDISQVLANIRRFGTTLSPKPLILQANAELLNEASPNALASAASSLGKYVTHILLDGSGGTGKPLIADRLKPYVEELLSRDLVPIIAGGLNPKTIEPLEGGLVSNYPVGIDAETGLRNNYLSTMPKDSDFSPEKAAALVAKVLELRG